MAKPRSTTTAHHAARGCTRLALIAATTFLLASAVSADMLYLKNGRRITVDRFWEEGDQIFYEKNGSTLGFPKSLLERVERDQSPRSASNGKPLRNTDPRNEKASGAIIEARRSAQEGDLDKASRLYRQALSKAPDLILGRVELADLYLSRGDLKSAQAQLELAKRIAPSEPTVREKLGEVYYRRGRTALAIREWQRALELAPNPDILSKLKRALQENNQDIEFDELRRPNYLLRYDGVVNERIGRAVAAALDEEYMDLSQELHFTPQTPITVTLYTNREFTDVTKLPTWVSAVNDGEIRIPVQGLNEVTPKLRSILRHELIHSFVNVRTRGNCPMWFQEGLAQFLTGESSPDMYAQLKKARDNGSLLPLWSLEGSILHYTEDKAKLAYLESLAATQYIVGRRNRRALLQILDRLAERKSMNDSLRKVIGLDYQEFQTAWETDLGRYRSSSH